MSTVSIMRGLYIDFNINTKDENKIWPRSAEVGNRNVDGNIKQEFTHTLVIR